MEAARHFQEMEIKDLEIVQYPKEKASEKMEQIKILAKEFFSAPSAKGNLSVLERWFTELGVGWVLHVADGIPAEDALDASSWIWALPEIVDTFRLTLRFLSGQGSAEEEEPATESDDEEENMTEQLQLASVTQQAMLKIHFTVTSSWIPALTEIVNTFWPTSGLLPSHGSTEEEEPATESEE